MKLLAALCTLSLAACTVTSLPTTGQPVTPQRPGLAADTNTTAPGTFELEGGVYRDPGDQWATPTTLKYGYGERTELFVGWVPILHDDDRDVTVIGDSQLGIRHRYQDRTDDVPSAAIQALINLPTGNEDLGSPETDMSLAGIISGEVENVLLTGYGSFDLRGDPTGPGIDPGFSLALAGGTPPLGDWSGFGELAGVFVPARDLDSVFMTLGGVYQVIPELAFDVGLVIGLSNDAPDLALVFGFTRNFGDLVRLR